MTRGRTGSSLSSLSSFVAIRATELGQGIINSIVETLILAFENKEVCMEETVFPRDLERQIGVHQAKKSRRNVLGEENVVNGDSTQRWVAVIGVVTGCGDGILATARSDAAIWNGRMEPDGRRSEWPVHVSGLA